MDSKGGDGDSSRAGAGGAGGDQAGRERSRGGSAGGGKGREGLTSATRTIGRDDLLFWVQKLLKLEHAVSVEDCRDGRLFVSILQNIVDSRSARAVSIALQEKCSTRGTGEIAMEERLDNLALVDTLLKENGEHWGGDYGLVAQGSSPEVANLLLLLYQMYFKRCTTQVKRVKVRAQTAAVHRVSPGQPPTHPRPSTVVPSESARPDSSDEYDVYSAKLSAHASWLLELLISHATDFLDAGGGTGALWGRMAERVLSLHNKMSKSGALSAGSSCEAFEGLCLGGGLYFLANFGMRGSRGGAPALGEGEMTPRAMCAAVVRSLREQGLRVREECEGLAADDIRFDRNAHFEILDDLLICRVRGMLSPHDVHQSTSRAWAAFSSAHPQLALSSGYRIEPPFDLEDAFSQWIGATGVMALHADDARHRTLLAKLSLAGGGARAPPVEDLQMDLSDGRGLLLLASYHHPAAVAASARLVPDCCSLSDKTSNMRAALDACACLGVSCTMQAGDFVHVNPQLKGLVLHFLSLLFLRLERPTAFTRYTPLHRYAESYQAPKDTGGGESSEGLLAETAGGSRVMLQILQVDTSRSSGEQRPLAEQGRTISKVSSDGVHSDVLILDTPAASPSLRLEHSLQEHSREHLAINVEAARSPHAALLESSAVSPQSPTPRIVPTAASDSPSQPRFSPMQESYTYSRDSEAVNISYGVDSEGTPIKPFPGGPGAGWGGGGGAGGDEGSWAVVQEAADGLLSSGIIRQDLQALAKSAMEEDDDDDEEEDVENILRQMDEELAAYKAERQAQSDKSMRDEALRQSREQRSSREGGASGEKVGWNGSVLEGLGHEGGAEGGAGSHGRAERGHVAFAGEEQIPARASQEGDHVPLNLPAQGRLGTPGPRRGAGHEEAPSEQSSSEMGGSSLRSSAGEGVSRDALEGGGTSAQRASLISSGSLYASNSNSEEGQGRGASVRSSDSLLNRSPDKAPSARAPGGIVVRSADGLRLSEGVYHADRGLTSSVLAPGSSSAERAQSSGLQINTAPSPARSAGGGASVGSTPDRSERSMLGEGRHVEIRSPLSGRRSSGHLLKSAQGSAARCSPGGGSGGYLRDSEAGSVSSPQKGPRSSVGGSSPHRSDAASPRTHRTSGSNASSPNRSSARRGHDQVAVSPAKRGLFMDEDVGAGDVIRSPLTLRNKSGEAGQDGSLRSSGARESVRGSGAGGSVRDSGMSVSAAGSPLKGSRSEAGTPHSRSTARTAGSPQHGGSLNGSPHKGGSAAGSPHKGTSSPMTRSPTKAARSPQRVSLTGSSISRSGGKARRPLSASGTLSARSAKSVSPEKRTRASQAWEDSPKTQSGRVSQASEPGRSSRYLPDDESIEFISSPVLTRRGGARSSVPTLRPDSPTELLPHSFASKRALSRSLPSEGLHPEAWETPAKGAGGVRASVRASGGSERAAEGRVSACSSVLSAAGVRDSEASASSVTSASRADVVKGRSLLAASHGGVEGRESVLLRDSTNSCYGEGGGGLSVQGGASAWLRLGDEAWEGTQVHMGGGDQEGGGELEVEEIGPEHFSDEEESEDGRGRPFTAPSVMVEDKGWAGGSGGVNKNLSVRMRMGEAARDIEKGRREEQERLMEQRRRANQEALMKVLQSSSPIKNRPGKQGDAFIAGDVRAAMRALSATPTDADPRKVGGSPARARADRDSAGEGIANRDVEALLQQADSARRALADAVATSPLSSPHKQRAARYSPAASPVKGGRAPSLGAHSRADESPLVSPAGSPQRGASAHSVRARLLADADDAPPQPAASPKREGSRAGTSQNGILRGSCTRAECGREGSQAALPFGSGRTSGESVGRTSGESVGGGGGLPDVSDVSDSDVGRSVEMLSSVGGASVGGRTGYSDSWGLSGGMSTRGKGSPVDATEDAREWRQAMGDMIASVERRVAGDADLRAQSRGGSARRERVLLGGAGQHQGVLPARAEPHDEELKFAAPRAGSAGRGRQRAPVHQEEEEEEVLGRGGGSGGGWAARGGVRAIGAGVGGMVMEYVDEGGIGVGGDDEKKKQQRFESFRLRREEENRKRKEVMASARKKGFSGGGFQPPDEGPGSAQKATPQRRQIGDPVEHSDGARQRLAPKGGSAPRNSNRKLIRNSITHVLLVSEADRKKREAAVAALDNDPSGRFFLLLSRDPNLKFRGLYAMDVEEARIELIYGSGPADVDSRGVREFLRYDSGSKSFKDLSTKDIGLTTDGVILHPHVMKSTPLVRRGGSFRE